MGDQLKVGDIERVAIGTVAFGGNGLGRINNMVIFVPFAIDGEEVEVEIGEVRKNYCVGKIKKLCHPSPRRIEPRCPYYSLCGGCQYQHIAYEYQLEIKERQVKESFERVGKFSLPPVKSIIPSIKFFNYRGKAEYHFDFDETGRPRIGFMDTDGSNLINIQRCEIVDESINRACNKLREEFVAKKDFGHKTRYTLWSQTENQLDRYISRTVNGMKYRIPSDGFFQTNLSLMDRLAEQAINMSNLTESDTVLDCYCGSGFFSLLLSPFIRQIFGIEVDKESVKCARYNLQNCGFTNVHIYQGRVEKVVKKSFIKKGVKIDVVFLDPPRMGCSKDILSGITELKPGKIIYISCNPATQARDIRYLADQGFFLRELQPIDMFPQTRHIEVIALLDSGG